jgi:4-hydroxybenzoate polyprenyltransferase
MGSLATQRVSARRTSRWRTALKLGRVSNLPTVWSNVIAATALAGGAPVEIVVLVAVAISLLYVGGMFLNDAFDSDVDALQRSERPIPAGDISAGAVFAGGFALLGLGVGTLAAIDARVGGAGLALAAAILLYDWHHKGNPLSPLVMGLCRGLVYVTAAVAAAMTVSHGVLIAALAVAAYVAGLTHAARHEARDALGSLWPLTLLAAPVLLAVPQLNAAPAVALAFAAFLACAFWATQLLLRRGPGDIPRTIGLLIAGIAVNDALLAATTGDEYAPFACLACFGLTLLFQRYVPAS